MLKLTLKGIMLSLKLTVCFLYLSSTFLKMSFKRNEIKKKMNHPENIKQISIHLHLKL